MKFNEHRGCSCDTCRRASGTVWGQFVHRYVNRRIRHFYKSKLRKVEADDDVIPRVFSTLRF